MGRKPDKRSFVQVTQRLSMGIEVSRGQAWVGVDQQVGHGSADALFALTDEQYAAALVDETVPPDGFLGECWSGKREDLRLFSPGGGAWTPEHWFPSRTRMLPPRFAGEIWWHVDALGEPVDSERATVSQDLAARTGLVATDADGVRGMTFRLVGDGAYPRPAALIAGLTAGSDRERVRAVLGEPVEAGSETYAVEGDRVRLGYVDGGLVEIALERPATKPLPDGPIRPFLAVLGEPEEGAAYREVARLAGDARRRWAASPGIPRRLIAFAGGVDVQVDQERVLSTRLRLRSATHEPAYQHADTLFPGAPWPPSREVVHEALGAPDATNGGTDLHRYGARDLVVEYAGDTPSVMTAVLRGVSVAHGFLRWRSGEFVLFLDVLGREGSDPLVDYVRGLAGVRVSLRGGVVDAVAFGSGRHQAERLEAFIDGMPPEATREDIRLGAPDYVGDHDDLRDLTRGWIHVHSSDGTRITAITVSRERPARLDVRPRRYGLSGR